MGTGGINFRQCGQFDSAVQARGAVLFPTKHVAVVKCYICQLLVLVQDNASFAGSLLSRVLNMGTSLQAGLL